jgi:hypothetical protein
MTEEELLYQALSTPLGLVVRADHKRLRRARSRCLERDPALHELAIIGPDASGQTYLLRTDRARSTHGGS